ncbi:2-octaprenyl-6-methoxyphenyl hydroxylase [Thalassotalea psychrophila]|uniref:2-octaprenyl-6-methoxyphenyl hydroxylase n=1 Tax=Thalassotalea psychrophila TaxID=3065647 RepID=A0ABY9TWS0_9GAMM|nr:2-octaprenyl-6-methoxyphenyl hydroxylase [Colwelliaceae bacterium SQ149]
MTTPINFDVIISGAGLAGASMALALSKLSKADGTKLSIAVVEAFAIKDNLPKSYDARVIALSHGTATYLQELGVWQALKPDAMAIANIHISDRGYYGKARMNATDYGVSALGFVSEMQAIGNCLITPLKQCANVHFIEGQSITNIKWQKNEVTVVLANGNSLSANLLLGCDGGQSVCRQQAKISSQESDYQQVAIIANVTPSKAHKGRAFERFTEYGPLAMLPMTDDRCSLVWTVTPEQVTPLLALSDDEFSQQLENAFGSWLGSFRHVGKRFSYPLKLIQADEQIHHRMALVGNASHTLHPIAGQGFNLGMRDVKQMAQTIAQALAENADIGSHKHLRHYADNRAEDHNQVIALTDSLVHLFSNKHLPLVVGRGVGLKVLNYLAPLKKALAEKTMGHTR